MDPDHVEFDANEVLNEVSEELRQKTVENAMLRSALKRMRRDFVKLTAEQVVSSEEPTT